MSSIEQKYFQFTEESESLCKADKFNLFNLFNGVKLRDSVLFLQPLACLVERMIEMWLGLIQFNRAAMGTVLARCTLTGCAR